MMTPAVPSFKKIKLKVESVRFTAWRNSRFDTKVSTQSGNSDVYLKEISVIYIPLDHQY